MGWLSLWHYRARIVIDKTKVVGTNLDFPVLIKLDSTNFDFNHLASDGHAIRFTAADGVTLLDYEREEYDAIGQTGYFWVKIPSLTDLVDTIIYIYYTPLPPLTPSVDTFTKLYSYTSGARFDNFVDTSKVDSSTGVTFNTNKPTKYVSNPIEEPPGPNLATWDYDKDYANVLPDGSGGFKVWFGGADTATVAIVVTYETSNDGFTWVKPNLGLINYGGNTNNNIENSGFNPSVVYDPSGISSRKYLMVLEIPPGASTGGDAYLYISPDGINWNYLQTLSTGYYIESKSLYKRLDGRWIIYFSFDHGANKRKIGALLSDTTNFGGTWTDLGTLINTTSNADQKYYLGVHYDNGTYYGFVGDFANAPATINQDLYVSPDGIAWTLRQRNWIPIGTGTDWDRGMILAGKSLIKVGNDWRYYYIGTLGNHNAGAIAQDARMGLATIGYNRIFSVDGIGTLTTTAFTPTTGLFLNTDASDGGLRAEVLDASDDSVIPGFSVYDFNILTSDVYSYEAKWAGLSMPTGIPIKIKFYLNLKYGLNVDGSSTAAWNADYKGVWHLDEAGTPTTWKDSTINVNNGIGDGTPKPSSIAGQIYNGADFNGADVAQSRIDLGIKSSLNNVDKTYSAWVKVNVQQYGSIIMMSNSSAGAYLGILNVFGKLWFNWSFGSGSYRIYETTNVVLTSGVKTYVVATQVDKGVPTIIINGVQVPIILKSSAGIDDLPLDEDWSIGSFGDYPATLFFSGMLDEVRNSSVARSVDWALTEYNNQSDPLTFYNIGLEEFSNMGNFFFKFKSR